MIHYHGGPITPVDVAVKVYQGSHAFVSFYEPRDIDIISKLCQSFALDNGAFSIWKKGVSVNWNDYYSWVDIWKNHPGFDFAVIPDVIDGTEAENDELVEEWPFKYKGAPVWHLHESISRLDRLCCEWPRVCLGSSGQFAKVGSLGWWDRMYFALKFIIHKGQPKTKLHGLRMLDKRVFSRLPLSSADSTNVARNHSQHKFKRSGHYIIKQEIESMNSSSHLLIDQKGLLDDQ